MEVMEEGNLMDRVPILIERDLKYYQDHQSVLQEPICPGVVGGKLDFPRYASFASIKIVMWWEEEYFAAYREYSGLLHSDVEAKPEDNSTIVVKNSDPDKFVGLVTKSAQLLMDHLHVLTQESLDHADLSVLTATLGAAALIRNCLKIYMCTATVIHYPPRGDDEGGSLKLSHKHYSEMAEALAERLLDLHTRILLIYVVQDADCLDWESDEPFFESERGSYTVQMWWHYLRGTKDDLWNTVPPKMAQRIFGGMLNETLSVLTVRYSQQITSTARSQLHLVDICNMLFCIAELLPYFCEKGEELIGLNFIDQSDVVRDIHAKCREFFYCLLLRGAPLGLLGKLFRDGVSKMKMFTSRQDQPSPWIIFTNPKLFPNGHPNQSITNFDDLDTSTAIVLELKVLLTAPAANWSFLVKILLMGEAKLTSIILPHLIKHLPSPENFKNVAKWLFPEPENQPKCSAFLCRRECFNPAELIVGESDPVGQTNCQLVLALTYILVALGKATDIKSCLISALENAPPHWCDCLDKRQVWNQKRPPWLEGIMYLIYPVLDGMVDMLVDAVETGSSMYQSMSLVLNWVSEMFECIPEGLYKVAVQLQDIISMSTKPLRDSVLLQLLITAVYTELIKHAERFEKEGNNAKAGICYSLSEAVCSIDEDDKHTDEIDKFLVHAKDTVFSTEGLPVEMYEAFLQECRDTGVELPKNSSSIYPMELDVGSAHYIAELLASDVLIYKIGKQSLKIIYAYLKNNQDWIYEQLGASDTESTTDSETPQGQNIIEAKTSVLKSMFFIGKKPFDQLLTGQLKIDYQMWLETPLSMTHFRADLQLKRRTDFQPEEELSSTEASIVAAITKIFKAIEDIQHPGPHEPNEPNEPNEPKEEN